MKETEKHESIKGYNIGKSTNILKTNTSKDELVNCTAQCDTTVPNDDV